MFQKEEIERLYKKPWNKYYKKRVVNQHDVWIENTVNHHEWRIVSNYSDSSCYVLHRHSRIYEFHRHKRIYSSFTDAMKAIEEHDIRTNSMMDI